MLEASTNSSIFEEMLLHGKCELEVPDFYNVTSTRAAKVRQKGNKRVQLLLRFILIPLSSPCLG